MGKTTNNVLELKNIELLDKFKAYQENSGVNEELAFIKELEKAILFFPIKKQTDYAVDMSKEDGTPVNFLLIQEQLESYLPAFTSLDLLKENIKDSDFVPLTYPHIVDLVYSNHHIDGFYLNPYSLNLKIDAPLMKYFSNISKHSISNAKSVKFGEPEEYPNVLISLIISVLKEHKEVDAAYFTLMQIDDNLPEFLVVVSGEYDENELYKSISARVNHLLSSEVLLNITNLTSYIGKQALDENSKPFYVREN